MAGLGNRVDLVLDGVPKTDLVNAKVFTARLKAGDIFRVRGGGGGGFGPPWERPPEQVREDVRQGYVTLEAARSDYGVMLDRETLEIDHEATATCRAGMAAA